jgi:hypothetical protein
MTKGEIVIVHRSGLIFFIIVSKKAGFRTGLFVLIGMFKMLNNMVEVKS